MWAQTCAAHAVFVQKREQNIKPRAAVHTMLINGL